MDGQSLVLDAVLDDDTDVRRVQQFAAVGARTGARLGAAGGPFGAGVGAGLGSAAGYLVGVGVTGVDPAEQFGARRRTSEGGTDGDDADDGTGAATADRDGSVTIPVAEESATE